MDRDAVEAQVRAQMTELRLALDQVSGDARKALLAEMDKLDGVLAAIRVEEADEVASRLDGAVEALEAVRTAQRLDAVAALGRVIAGLTATERTLRHEVPVRALTLVDRVAAAAPAVAIAAGAVATAAVIGKVVSTLTSKDFPSLKNEYVDLFERCTVRDDRRQATMRMAQRIRSGQERYDTVGTPLGVPWTFVGVLHAMEAGLDFATHLHNGDPLTARTVNVPAGRPKTGVPPFTWEDSATDALRQKKLDRITDWSLPHMLFLLESFNGFGYRGKHIPTPYLWSFSNLYEKGKFVADHVFDPEAKSKQCGAALLLKELG